MIRIIAEAEKTYPHDRYLKMVPEKEVSDAVSYAVCVMADHLDAAAILAPTKSGWTATHISRFRPKQPILAFAPDSDGSDADKIYDTLEQKIIPLYYNMSDNGIPHEWVHLMKETIKSTAAGFSARRMVKQYIEKFYSNCMKGVLKE